jgi:hypothetical protein
LELLKADCLNYHQIMVSESNGTLLIRKCSYTDAVAGQNLQISMELNRRAISHIAVSVDPPAIAARRTALWDRLTG